MNEELKQENSKDFGLPKVGTKEFNDLASGLFGGKPKQEKLTYTESAKKEERISNCTMITVNKKTLEEAAEILIKLNRQDAFYEGVKWQQERMYSEIDLEVAFFEGQFGRYSFNDWFEQFKKK